MKKKYPVSIITTLILCIYIIVPIAANTGETNITGACEYAFVYMNKKADLISIGDPQTALKPGDKLKMYFNPQADVYLYLFHTNPRQDLSLLFPDGPDFYVDGYPQNGHYFIPPGIPGDKKQDVYWFALDDSTTSETFYMIFSTVRLPDLEKLHAEYNAMITHNTGSKKKIKKVKESLVAMLETYTLQTIEQQKQATLDTDELFGADQSDFYQIAGNIKGYGFDMVSLQVNNIYAKKIIITH